MEAAFRYSDQKRGNARCEGSLSQHNNVTCRGLTQLCLRCSAGGGGGRRGEAGYSLEPSKSTVTRLSRALCSGGREWAAGRGGQERGAGQGG